MPRIDTGSSGRPPTRDLRNLLRAAFTPDDLYDFCEKHPLFQPCLGRFGADHRLEDMIQIVLAFTDRKLYWEELLDGVAEHAPHEYNRTASQMGWPLVEEPPEPAPDT
jgi:hypothetical protein